MNSVPAQVARSVRECFLVKLQVVQEPRNVPGLEDVCRRALEQLQNLPQGRCGQSHVLLLPRGHVGAQVVVETCCSFPRVQFHATGPGVVTHAVHPDVNVVQAFVALRGFRSGVQQSAF